ELAGASAHNLARVLDLPRTLYRRHRRQVSGLALRRPAYACLPDANSGGEGIYRVRTRPNALYVHSKRPRAAKHLGNKRPRKLGHRPLCAVWQSERRSLHPAPWRDTLHAVRLVAYRAYTFAFHHRLDQRCQWRELVQRPQGSLPILHDGAQAASVVLQRLPRLGRQLADPVRVPLARPCSSPSSPEGSTQLPSLNSPARGSGVLGAPSSRREEVVLP